MSSTDQELKWRKATVSNANGQCVELARTADGVAVRDSKDPDGPRLYFTRGEFAAWADGVMRGEFDDLM